MMIIYAFFMVNLVPDNTFLAKYFLINFQKERIKKYSQFDQTQHQSRVQLNTGLAFWVLLVIWDLH